MRLVPGYSQAMGVLVLLLLAGLALALILFAVTDGRLVFLPIVLVVPLGLLGFRRRRR